MALTTFNPSIQPSPGTGRKTSFKLLKAEFGDGYTQVTRDGLNHARRTLDLSWDALDDSQANSIADFFVSMGGDTVFYYTPPRESTPVKWTCEEFEDGVSTDGLRQISAKLIQSFTLET